MRGGGGWDSMTSTCMENGGRALGGSALPQALGGGGYEPHNVLEARSPAPAWHMNHITANTMKQEPMDHDSSAYGSGSDGFHSSSSPCGSDHNSRDSNPPSSVPSSNATENIQIPQYYSTPIMNRLPIMPYQQQQSTNSFNPLTPPSFDTIITPSQNQESSTETPSSEVTPPKSPKSQECQDGNGNYYSKDGDDHLKRLQMAFERNNMLPDSPKGSETHDSGDEDCKSDYELDEVDEHGVRAPRVNSHGKVKIFKCKQCQFVAVTKLDFWEHSRAHIKAEKLLTCPKCPFVTEYKHHLEYHLRNHFGSKPFKCDKCSYSCVNKSMLNSHLKSHSNVYQYRCSDCTYATKYCHSLKLHLRKYKHSPAMVLNQDGTPNPLPIIDVYGTRRGPKQKRTHQDQDESLGKLNPNNNHNNNNNNQPSQHPIFPHFMMPNSQTLSFPYGPLLTSFPNPILFPQMSQMSSNPSSPESQDSQDSESTVIKQTEEDENEDEDEMEDEEIHQPPAALDLSKPEISLPINIPEVPTTNKNRRKGRAFKLERIAVPKKEQCSEEDEPEPESKSRDSKPPPPTITTIETPVQHPEANTTKKESEVFNCQYCDMAFRDIVMYTMHMGYHGYKDPFTCNMCGEQSADKVSFFLHIARTSHS